MPITTKPALPEGWIEHVTIRLLRKPDLPALEWDGEYRHFRRLYADIYQHHSLGRALMWVAEYSSESLIGQLFVQLASSRAELADGRARAYIYGFRIKGRFRGYGLGTRMMNVVEAELVRRRFRWVCLNVSRENPDAIRLYEKLGYQVVAEELGRWSYIDDQGHRQEINEPAWRMEKELPRLPAIP